MCGRVHVTCTCARACVQITLSCTELVFQQLGLCIDTATDGDQAMDMLQKRDYDLVLVDVNLPTISGYALCSWYKQMCIDEGRKVAYVCAITADPDEATCEAFGMNRCLAKPISTQVIVETIREYWAAAEKRSPQTPPSHLATSATTSAAVCWDAASRPLPASGGSGSDSPNAHR